MQANILVIINSSKEHAQSQESLYLESMLKIYMERIFGKVKITNEPEQGITTPYILLIPNSRVFISEASLQAMKKQLDSGVDAIIPRRLTSFPIAEAPQTLRAYQNMESQLLEQDSQTVNPDIDKVDIVLFRVEIWDKLVKSSPQIMSITHDALQKQEIPIYRIGVYYILPDYYGWARQDIFQFLPPNPQQILDIGCAKGFTGELLEKAFDCQVTGVELNPTIAQEARSRLSRVITGDILTVELEETYDVVLATDVIEHLTDPSRFIKKLLSVLKPNGRIILTTPNVGHYSVVEDLIAGRWDYIPQGLLCYTHLRFFTKPTLVDWIQSWGITQYEIIPQTTPLPERILSLPNHLNPDWESLRTQGFYIILYPY